MLFRSDVGEGIDIRIFRAKNPPPPFESKSGENKGGGFLGCNNQNLGSFWPIPLVKLTFRGLETAKFSACGGHFPLVNLTFSGPKPQKLLAYGEISPLKSTKPGPGFGPNLEISKSEISKTRGWGVSCKELIS